MSKLELISKSDFILSFGTFFDDNSDVKASILESVEKNGAKFIYAHPIDNPTLKSFYSQFIKYEVGSEEGICGLLLATFAKNCDETTKNFIDNLDLGYISAESSAGEEEFEEAKGIFDDANSKVLIVGNDILEHQQLENIVKLLASVKKYSDFEVVVLDENLDKKIFSCEEFDLEDIEDLKSFNGTLVYKLVCEDSDELICSKTFSNIAKVANENRVVINFKDEKIEKTLKVDEALTGTVAILKVKNSEDILSGYRYKQVKIEKVEA